VIRGPSDRGRPAGLRPWQDLSADEQVRLRVEYGRYLDRLPPTCDLHAKTARFRRWLAERGVDFPDPAAG
jgi:hypothetical protein